MASDAAERALCDGDQWDYGHGQQAFDSLRVEYDPSDGRNGSSGERKNLMHRLVRQSLQASQLPPKQQTTMNKKKKDIDGDCAGNGNDHHPKNSSSCGTQQDDDNDGNKVKSGSSGRNFPRLFRQHIFQRRRQRRLRQQNHLGTAQEERNNQIRLGRLAHQSTATTVGESTELSSIHEGGLCKERNSNKDNDDDEELDGEETQDDDDNDDDSDSTNTPQHTADAPNNGVVINNCRSVPHNMAADRHSIRSHRHDVRGEQLLQRVVGTRMLRKSPRGGNGNSAFDDDDDDDDTAMASESTRSFPRVIRERHSTLLSPLGPPSGTGVEDAPPLNYLERTISDLTEDPYQYMDPRQVMQRHYFKRQFASRGFGAYESDQNSIDNHGGEGTMHYSNTDHDTATLSTDVGPADPDDEYLYVPRPRKLPVNIAPPDFIAVESNFTDDSALQTLQRQKGMVLRNSKTQKAGTASKRLSLLQDDNDTNAGQDGVQLVMTGMYHLMEQSLQDQMRRKEFQWDPTMRREEGLGNGSDSGGGLEDISEFRNHEMNDSENTLDGWMGMTESGEFCPSPRLSRGQSNGLDDQPTKPLVIRGLDRTMKTTEDDNGNTVAATIAPPNNWTRGQSLGLHGPPILPPVREEATSHNDSNNEPTHTGGLWSGPAGLAPIAEVSSTQSLSVSKSSLQRDGSDATFVASDLTTAVAGTHTKSPCSVVMHQEKQQPLSVSELSKDQDDDIDGPVPGPPVPSLLQSPRGESMGLESPAPGPPCRKDQS